LAGTLGAGDPAGKFIGGFNKPSEGSGRKELFKYDPIAFTALPLCLVPGFAILATKRRESFWKE
jgi:hypothetical protein